MQALYFPPMASLFICRRTACSFPVICNKDSFCIGCTVRGVTAGKVAGLFHGQRASLFFRWKFLTGCRSLFDADGVTVWFTSTQLSLIRRPLRF
jgi:hypothetical protein